MRHSRLVFLLVLAVPMRAQIPTTLGNAAKPASPCCAVTGIQAATATVSAKVTASGESFQFTVTDARLLASLKVGQAVSANFLTHRVSVDGRTYCCTITTEPAPPSALPPARGGASSPPAGANLRPEVGTLALKGSGISMALPAVSYGASHAPGTPRVRGAVLTTPVRFDSRSVVAVRGGKTSTATVLHLRGLDGIERAPGLPDGARRLLEMHVRTLPAGESDHYIVNVAMAEEFIRAHPVPPDVKPADGGDDHSGCDKWTLHCAGEVIAHAADQTAAQFEKLRQDAVKAWEHATGEVANQWNAAEGCFADHKLPLPPIPVQFKITPSMSVHLEQSGSKDIGGGSASGTVQGTVTLGFPLESDFHVQGDLFYIPCLPFVIRPRSVSGTGTLTISEQLKTSVSATGKFDKVFTIPPTGGPVIPIEVIPIMIGDVPVAEVDISAYIEGNIEVGGNGAAEGHFEVTNPHKAAFDFACSGAGCNGNSRGMPDPTTAEEGASIKGSVFVRPDIFTALQVDFDYDALGARSGPQPYLLGTASGCAAVAAGQTAGGPATSSENHALTADLDWGVDLRAEALVGGQRVGNKYQHSFTGNKHLWFRDLSPGGSNALVAVVDAVGTVTAGAAAVHKVRMPSCYPYTNPVRYQITWTGGATPGASPVCQWQSGQGICTADPTKDLLISLKWPSAGTWSLSVVAVSDSHQRTFTPPPPPTQVSVAVRP